MLEYTPAVANRTRHLYDSIARVMPELEWPIHAPYVDEILRLKEERDAVILAHNYQTPEIYHCVADIVGDSLTLARRAAETEASVIVMAGVRFMAETAKLLSPERTVLLPDLTAGCSLATSINAEDVRGLKRRHPGVPVVSYVNTTAEVKAESDICCTSSNAVDVVESLGVDQVIMLPDGYLASYVALHTDVDILSWEGRCEVHETFTAEQVEECRARDPGLEVLAHPECSPEVLRAADSVGSTSQMVNYVKVMRPERVMLVTECSMSDNVAAECPDVDFVRPCNLCVYMKRISLPKILRSLERLSPRIEVDEAVAVKARRALHRMLEV